MGVGRDDARPEASSIVGAIGAMSGPHLISRQMSKMDMTSRTQQRFGAPDTPERRERDPVTLLAAIATNRCRFCISPQAIRIFS